MRDLYQVLGVAKNASADEIRKAYREISKKFHPDKVGNDQAAVARFREATSAYAILSDPAKRSRYDGSTTISTVGDLFLRHPVGKRVLETMLPSAPADTQQGTDRYLVLEAPATLLASGGILTFDLVEPSGERAQIDLEVPPHAEALPFCRLERLGNPGRNGGERGNLCIIVQQRRKNA